MDGLECIAREHGEVNRCELKPGRVPISGTTSKSILSAFKGGVSWGCWGGSVKGINGEEEAKGWVFITRVEQGTQGWASASGQEEEEVK